MFDTMTLNTHRRVVGTVEQKGVFPYDFEVEDYVVIAFGVANLRLAGVPGAVELIDVRCRRCVRLGANITIHSAANKPVVIMAEVTWISALQPQEPGFHPQY